MSEILQGDCLELMKAMPADSVDLVFCSPPYEAARTYGIDFKLKGQDWVDWSVARFVECVRVCRGMVCWVVEGQTRQFRWSAAPILFMADLHRAGVHLRKPPAFARVGIPGSGGPDWLRNDYEFIVCGSKGGKLPWSDNTAMGKPPKLGPGGEMSYRDAGGKRRNQWGGTEGKTVGTRRADGSRDAPQRPSHVYKNAHGVRTDVPIGTRTTGNKDPEKEAYRAGMRAVNGSREGDLNDNRATAFPVLANPGNVIKCIVGGGVMGSPLCHENEAPFPESLAEFFVRSFCKPGGTVLDCFCGSGTTLAVAKRTGRQYIGIDVRESQVALSRRRVAEIQVELIA